MNIIDNSEPQRIPVRRRSRGVMTTTISLSITPVLLDKVDRISQTKNESRSQTIGRLLEKGLKTNG